jgi:uncharacterized protein (TIGR03437 family)
MSRQKEFSRSAFGQLSLVAAALLGSGVPAFAQTTRPMVLQQSRYEIRSGEPAPLAASAETLDFLLHAKTRSVSIDGMASSGLVAGPNEAGDQILLAPSVRAKPGEYRVTLSATGQTGEVRAATMDVVVKPRVTVPNNATRDPVVLLNGWEIGYNNSCPIATSSSTTFGNLASYLVSDGVPVVYLFDNCAEDPGNTIEQLGNDLGAYLNSITYDSGAQVPHIDLVAHSMGGLIARAYLAGLQPNETFLPPSPTLVGKMVLIATPNFGSFVAGQYINSLPAGTQAAELVPGSSFLWNLATWNQGGDDLRGVSAIAVVGNAGTYTPILGSSILLNGASDGLVSLTSASIGFAEASGNTRVVPYCHVDPGAFTNPLFGTYACNAAGIANVTSTSHPTGEIVRSYLAGTTDWESIGTAPTADPYLDSNGGMFFALVNQVGKYQADVTSVEWGTVVLQAGGATDIIYYSDLLSGTGDYVVTSQSLGTENCGTLALPLGFSSAVRCKLGAWVYEATPLASVSGRVVSAGTTITLTGGNLGTQCGNCQVLAYPQGSTTSQTLTVTSWQNTAISVKLPSTLTGLVTIKVLAVAGDDAIGVFVEAPSTIAVSPSSLQFTYTTGGTVPAAQSIQISNSGTGTLAWTATTSASWIAISATSGTATSNPTVSVNPAGMAVGTYTGTVQIAASGASNTPQTVAVSLTIVAPPPSLAASPTTLTFQYTAGGAAPAAQTVAITDPGSGSVNWTASSDAFWVSLSATSGTTPGTISITANPANLAPGGYTTVVTIAAADGSVSAVAVAVTLTVQGAPAAGTITGVANAASYQTNMASATWVSIFGTNLSQLTYTWQGSDFVNGALPTTLEGVSVTINGLPAYVQYISPTQINVLAPDDATVGPVPVQVTTAGQISNTATVQKNQTSPAFLTFAGSYVAAEHTDYSLVGAANLIPGATTTPAQPGSTILLYGIGFGPATPAQPTGQLVSTAAPLANPVQITIGGQTAAVSFAGLVESGLYQFDVVVPNLPNGDAAVVATIGGVSTQTGVLVTVHQ